MLSRFTLSVAVVLLVSSGAWAGIMQYQDFHVGLQECIDLMHGHQEGDSFKSVLVTNNQSTRAPCPTLADQHQFGMLTQCAKAIGECAVISVLTTLDAMGMQDQLIGDCVDPKVQCQVLTLDGVQGLAKSDGPGQANAMNQAILTQNQTGTNQAGTVNEDSTIMALQQANLRGDACATGLVVSTMTVTTTQSQATF